MDAAFDDLHAAAAQFYQQFGTDEGAVGFERYALEYCAPEELERAIDVAHAQAEHRAHDEIVRLCDEETVRRIVAFDTVADNDRRLVEHRERAGQFVQVELSVRV